MADRITEVADRLQRVMESWRSIEVRVSTKQPLPSNPPAGVKNLFVGREQHYIETALGQRMLDETELYTGDLSKHEQNFTDGQRCANVFFDKSGLRQRRIEVLNHFAQEHKTGSTERPEPLLYLYVGKQPIYRAILAAEPLDGGRVLGRDCDRYLFHDVRLASFPLDAVYSLDRETSLPLKVEFYKDRGDRSPKSLVRVWEAKSFDETEGNNHATLLSENTYYNDGSNDGSSTVTVSEIHYGKNYPASMFWPVTQPGVEFNDLVRKTFTKVPDPANPAQTRKPSAPAHPKNNATGDRATTTTTKVAQDAVAPWTWSSISPSVLLGLGITMLGVGVVGKFRRGR